ncbi:MAG: MFS transporter [Verrucomicrobia bacterium]|nr:MFS transporter [Verrucomicrobiota bacterium]
MIFAILPWASFTFNSAVVGTAFLFSLKKFIENPAGLTFIMSIPGILAMAVSPVASFLSDRIWTRFGRRKPFIIVSWTGMLTAMILMPLMPNFWLLLAAYILYHFSSDLNSPMEPLKQEIIPPKDRVWATGAMAWCSNLATMTFYFVMLGRFDDVSYLAGLKLDGEWVIYWSAGLLLALLLLLIILGIKETDPKSSLRGQKLTLRNFVGGLLDRELWPVYLLVFGNACLNFYAGLGALSNLLYTDQWGYTKQEMGVNVAIGGIANLFIIGLLTAFASKLNRMKAYQTTLCLSLLGNVLYYCYVEFVLPDKRPTLFEIIVFGETLSVLAILTGLLYVPLVYDYVRRNRMGTYAAGASIVGLAARLITLNGVGLFVTFYASVFQPPAGEMTRVVLNNPATKSEFVSFLQQASWPVVDSADPISASNLAADVWQANGMIAQTGRTWEIRHGSKASETLEKKKTSLEAERSALLSREAMAREMEADRLRKQGQDPAAAQPRHSIQPRIEELSREIDTLDATLEARAESFRKQVSTVLGGRLMTDGDQLLEARMGQALVAEYAISSRPASRAIEEELDALRRENPAIIDMRPVKMANGYGLAVSALMPDGESRAEVQQRLQTSVDRLGVTRKNSLIAAGSAPASIRIQPAVTLDLQVVEDPVDTYVSPVSRILHAMLAPFGHELNPSRRLIATGSSLRDPAQTNHVRAVPGPVERSISVTAVLEPRASEAPPGAGPKNKLEEKLSRAAGDQSPEVLALYDRIEKSAAAQRITIAHPVLTSGYARMRYDYMSGYLWMFLMGTIGIALTLVFGRLEALGVIRKRGVEEALAS